ncbi:hypothetical protein [Haloferula sargassicola]|uniref:Beta-galactosidase n=1 Tax=Haloferula sargassicola TaxID=490096 RepID=A0ABP9UQL9_9BACT
MRALILVLSSAFLMAASAREERVINRDWFFHRGKLTGPDQADTPGTDWQAVDLPHDWAIAGPFDPEVSGEQGKLPWKGQGWYRKNPRPHRGRPRRRGWFGKGGPRPVLCRH